MNDDSNDELCICSECIREPYLSNEVFKTGLTATCSYCGEEGPTFTIEELADKVEIAFEQHYLRTATNPDSFESAMLADKESSYEWERKGDEITYVIGDAAQIPHDAAADIQEILENRHDDFEAAKMGEETEFSADSYYTRRRRNLGFLPWHDRWQEFERLLKTEARFFSRDAMNTLKSIFSGIETMRAADGRPIVCGAGPATELTHFCRARAFQDHDEVLTAIGLPDLHLGPPPHPIASSGRMNARGISVFYGATTPDVAIAEVRPPVGSEVVVASFEITRALKLLDLTALVSLEVSGSIFDPEYLGRLSRRDFMQGLTGRMARPVMPNDEALEYLPTQAIADYLSTESQIDIDGILFPSVQSAVPGLNVALFHKASRVEEINIPLGTKITSSGGFSTEDGWEPDYLIYEELPIEVTDENPNNPPDLSFYIPEINMRDLDHRPTTLRVMLGDVHVHDIEKVQFYSNKIKVNRHRISNLKEAPF